MTVNILHHLSKPSFLFVDVIEDPMQHTSHPKVLFLEDNADSREMVTMLLQLSDIDVVLAETCHDALMAADAQIDAFLLDGMATGGDSVRLCRILKARFPRKPVIFYTGMAQSTEIARAMQAGASAYLVKPYDGDLAQVIADGIRAAEFDSRNNEAKCPPSDVVAARYLQA